MQVLAKAADAEGKLSPGEYVIVEHSHGGGEDDVYTTHVNGDDYLTVDTSGAFVNSYGRYQGQSWSQDENGVVLLRSEFEARTDPNVLALEHPEDPVFHVTMLGITKTSPAQYVVEANPRDGSDQYRYYDAKTMLLTRVVTFEKDRHRHVVDYSDYRTAFGQTRAYQTHYSDGRPDNDTDAHVDSIAADPGRVPLAIPTARPLYSVPNNAPVQLPAHFTPYGIVVRATINGRGLDFILDSGASSITLDPGVAHNLGLAPYGKQTQTIGGEIDMSRTLVKNMRIGALELDNVTLNEAPITFDAGDSRIVGLMGCDFIAGSVVGIDFGAQTVTVYSRDTFDPFAVGAIARRPIDVDDCVPRIGGSVESVPGSFLIDTGAFATTLYNSYVAKLPHAVSPLGQVSSIETAGGSVRTHTEAVSDMIFGPAKFETADVIVPSESIWDMLAYDGIFGRDALSHFAIFLDYGGRVVYFKSEK